MGMDILLIDIDSMIPNYRHQNQQEMARSV